jgi:hypothetical protein
MPTAHATYEQQQVGHASPVDQLAIMKEYLVTERGRLISAAWEVESYLSLGVQMRRFDVTLERDDGQLLRIGSTWDLEETQILAARYQDANAMIEILNSCGEEIEDNWDEQDILFRAWSESEQGAEWLHRLHHWLQRADLNGATSISFTPQVSA